MGGGGVVVCERLVVFINVLVGWNCFNVYMAVYYGMGRYEYMNSLFLYIIYIYRYIIYYGKEIICHMIFV